MRERRPLFVLCALLLSVGCDGPQLGADAGMDAAAGDAGRDAGPPPAPDAGVDAYRPPRPDGGGVRATMCDPTFGVECDGDWAGRCTTACAATECCSPLAGRFGCQPRNADGTCPAADIWVDTDRITGNYSIEWQNFDSAGCAFGEGCVDAPGWRRLLKFDTWTPNTGNADLFLGRPGDMPDLYEYSACHDHYHFNSYARYALYDSTGAVVARGHKQAFCLLDFYRYPGTDGTGARYTCGNQGIQAGWQDVYGSHLDCQWVDVTDVAPGEYTLRIELNFEGVLLESNYDNNVAEVTVTIPTEDVTAACPPGTAEGAGRSCGLTRSGPHTCTPGAMVRVACSAACGLGSCTGDPFLRVCDLENDPECTSPVAIGANDDSGCGGGRCGGSGDCCPQTTVTCPASGSIVVFYGPYDATEAATCDVMLAPVP